jgi:hypothetical protein
MRRIIAQCSKVVLVLAALGFTVGLGAGVASAQNPHFIDSKTSLTVQSDGDLVVKFKESGVGDSLNIDYVFSAEATVTCTCVTNSGRCPKAANKQTFSEDTATGGTFSPKNGSVSATLTITAPECPSGAPPTCGGGQSFELSAISYTDISLTDTTNTLTAGNLATSAGPLTFFTCPE